jgi:isoquinoline 1-oxidoreductase beta subunit
VHRVVCADRLRPGGESADGRGADAVRHRLRPAAALHGELTLKDGKVQQINFHDYPVLRLDEMPKVEVHIVPSTEQMGGCGEPGTPPIAPAVGNALFALTGKRLRSLPFRLA